MTLADVWPGCGLKILLSHHRSFISNCPGPSRPKNIRLLSLVTQSRQRLTPQKLSDQNANLASYTQTFCRRYTAPRRAKKTTWHWTELIDDSLGYTTRAGSRRNEESSLLFEQRAGPGADLDSCLVSHVDNGAICFVAFTGRINVIFHPQMGRERLYG